MIIHFGFVFMMQQKKLYILLINNLMKYGIQSQKHANMSFKINLSKNNNC